MKRNKVGGMDEIERGMASKAEQMAVLLFEEFKRAEIKKKERGKNWVVYDIFDEFDDFSEMPEL
jgi:hypothetical protein